MTIPPYELKIRVLLSIDAPDGTTRYVDQLVDGASPRVALSFFTWRAALGGSFDVFHVHWPEFIIRDRSRVKRMSKLAAMLVLVGLLRIRRIPIVRTVHNLTPHEGRGRLEGAVLRFLDRNTAFFIRLNPTTPVRPNRGDAVILHGHYRARFETIPRARQVRGRALYLGLIKPYKGVEELIAAAEKSVFEDLSLRIVGRPSHDLGDLVESACTRDTRISSLLKFVGDDELVAEMSAAELVVLPYKQLENSGVALVALSLERPIVLPANPSTIALQTEVGAEWVHLYEGEFNTEVLDSALLSVQSNPPKGRPNLEGRDWPVVGRLHEAAYRAALETARGPR